MTFPNTSDKIRSKRFAPAVHRLGHGVAKGNRSTASSRVPPARFTAGGAAALGFRASASW